MKNAAVASEGVYNGAKISAINGKDELTIALLSVIPAKLTAKNTVFICIGTDRSTGDSLGPLVGTYLSGLGYNVCGTVDDPTHALNLAERIEALPKRKKIIAIDASLGNIAQVGALSVAKGAIKPGAGVGKNLPPVGDYAITGVVNVGGFMEYMVLQNTRLSVVMRMARDITSAIVNVFPVDGVITPEVERMRPTVTPKRRGRPRKKTENKTEVFA